jgi:flagellar biosynthesis GTPase FlhF
VSKNTTYNILVNGEVVASKSKKASAVEAADALRGDNPDASIEVQTGAGNVVHTVKVKGKHSAPWTRTETHDGIEVEVPAGYTVGYTRSRVGAVVARADDKSGWLVLTADGQSLEAANTKEAREITNGLAADYAASREEAKAAEKVAKAEAKAKRDKERAEAKEAKDAEKAAKAKEREEAKAKREAEKQAEADRKAAAKAEKEQAEADSEEPVEVA